jgi:RimJ/RimL family protein N-acetyltransferase
VQWATANRVYVVLDMHAAPGGQANGFIYDPTSPGMWSSGSDEDQTVALWRAIAHRYSRTNTIAGYDLLNEPWAWPKSALPVVYRSIIAAIRSVDSTHMIIVEGNRDARDFSWLSRPLDHNMMYSVHLYLWARGGLSGEQHDLAGYARIAHRQGVPLWIGEFGEDYPSRVADQVRQFNGEPTVAGWAFWTWKKAPDWAGSLDAIAVSPAWRALIRWIAVPEFRRRPSPSEATRAMAQFLQAIRFAATTVNPAMVAALHAQ